MSFAVMMLIAVGFDLAVGWPKRLHAVIGHPVMWIGALVNLLEGRLNRETDSFARRKMLGAVALVLCLVPVVAVTLALQSAFSGWAGAVVCGVAAWPLVALRSMHAHVAAVAAPLERGDLPKARYEVSMIVGRETATLDEAGVARAALESLAENTSDGIVAPLFWGVLFGLPGIAAYKVINTLDSMIGHRTAKHEAFGWASAKLDDLVNLPAARLTGLMFAAVSGRFLAGLKVMRRDAPKHRSPNAGWPEAAMAAALSVRLSGPRTYEGARVEEDWVNAEGADPSAADLRRGLALYARAMVLGIAALLALAVIL